MFAGHPEPLPETCTRPWKERTHAQCERLRRLDGTQTFLLHTAGEVDSMAIPPHVEVRLFDDQGKPLRGGQPWRVEDIPLNQRDTAFAIESRAAWNDVHEWLASRYVATRRAPWSHFVTKCCLGQYNNSYVTRDTCGRLQPENPNECRQATIEFCRDPGFTVHGVHKAGLCRDLLQVNKTMEDDQWHVVDVGSHRLACLSVNAVTGQVAAVTANNHELFLVENWAALSTAQGLFMDRPVTGLAFWKPVDTFVVVAVVDQALHELGDRQWEPSRLPHLNARLRDVTVLEGYLHVLTTTGAVWRWGDRQWTQMKLDDPSVHVLSGFTDTYVGVDDNGKLVRALAHARQWYAMEPYGLPDKLRDIQTLDAHRWVVLTIDNRVLQRGLSASQLPATFTSLLPATTALPSPRCPKCTHALWLVVPVLLVSLVLIVIHCVYVAKNPM